MTTVVWMSNDHVGHYVSDDDFLRSGDGNVVLLLLSVDQQEHFYRNIDIVTLVNKNIVKPSQERAVTFWGKMPEYIR